MNINLCDTISNIFHYYSFLILKNILVEFSPKFPSLVLLLHCDVIGWKGKLATKLLC